MPGRKSLEIIMPYKLPFMIVLLSVIVCGSGLSSGAYEQIRDQAAVSQVYTIDDEAEVRVPIGQSVRFDVTENEYGLKTFYVYPGTSESLTLCYLDSHGHVVDISSTHLQKCTGYLKQVGTSVCLAIIEWKIEEDLLRVNFCVSTDKQKNYAKRQKMRDGKVSMAMSHKNRKPYPVDAAPETERLAGFVRLWSEVKFNFAFFDQVPDLDWDQVLVDFIPKVQKAETENAYYKVLLECMALLRDGHTDVWGPGRGSTRFTELCRLPIELGPASGGRAVITAICENENLNGDELKKKMEDANLKLYEEVTHINGKPIRQILEEKIYPYICASTDHVRDLKAIRHLVRGPYQPEVTVRIRGLDGKKRDVTLVCGVFYVGTKREIQEFECRELEDGIVYVNLPGFDSKEIVEEFEAIFPRVQKAKGLILDVRYNGGGNSSNGYAIIKKLTNKMIEGSKWKTRKYMPAFRAWGNEEMWHEGENFPIMPSVPDPYIGPIVVLIGPHTVSAAEDFVVALHASERATLVGQKTAGTTGQPLVIDLPFGGGARICTKRDTYPDGRDFVGVGVIPDVEVHPTIEALATDEDFILKKGIEVLKSKM